MHVDSLLNSPIPLSVSLCLPSSICYSDFQKLNIRYVITVTSKLARWRLKSAASWLFTLPFIHAPIPLKSVNGVFLDTIRSQPGAAVAWIHIRDTRNQPDIVIVTKGILIQIFEKMESLKFKWGTNNFWMKDLFHFRSLELHHMSAKAYKHSLVCSTAFSDKQDGNRKVLHYLPFGNPPVSREFPSQRTNNAQRASMYDIIIDFDCV